MAFGLPKGINEHWGKNIDKMSELLKAGKVPIFAARLMQARLKYGDEFYDLWNYANTSDLPIYTRRDKFGDDIHTFLTVNGDDIYTFLTVNNKNQIANNYARQALELIISLSLSTDYGAIVPDEIFEEWRDQGDKIGLIKIPRKKITTRTYLTQDQVLKELTWRILARHPNEVPAEFAEDKNLLREYFDCVASKTNSPDNMALYVGDFLEDKTTFRVWCILSGYKSDACGWFHSGYADGRFLDIAPEALPA